MFFVLVLFLTITQGSTLSWSNTSETCSAVEDTAMLSIHAGRTLINSSSCNNCLCFTADPVKCGKKMVTNGEKCGTDLVTDADKCGTTQVTDKNKCGEKKVIWLLSAMTFAFSAFLDLNNDFSIVIPLYSDTH